MAYSHGLRLHILVRLLICARLGVPGPAGGAELGLWRGTAGSETLVAAQQQRGLHGGRALSGESSERVHKNITTPRVARATRRDWRCGQHGKLAKLMM